MSSTVLSSATAQSVTTGVEPIRRHIDELAKCNGVAELESSAAYQRLRPKIARLLETPIVGTAEHSGLTGKPAGPGDDGRLARVIAWNIERGIRAEGIIQALKTRPELADADALLLSEVDFGMARTRNRFVAADIADALGFHYAFIPCYLALSKGNGSEKGVEGDNRESLHGNALLSRYPLIGAHGLALPNGKDKMKGNEKRIGCQRAIIADVAHPAGTFRAVTLHLDAHSSQKHRRMQMNLVLDHLEKLSPPLPTLIGGDWNTTTHDASRALYSILGYVRRVAMGVRRVVRWHYPYPERWFERRLFADLDRRGYDYRSLNIPGECTLHYDMDDLAANLNLRDWVPGWCFHFIRWALGRTGGRCSLKLDWFAGRGLHVDRLRPGHGPSVVHDIRESGQPVSDHDPIVVGFEIPPREDD
ncbi:MAG TPA: endonuclease/exonuclease/phosphatase family protein [Terriglobia bacterium]|nr:endonuclease/exonuclease/phosphatase family protein [Terriglobia bacterium]